MLTPSQLGCNCRRNWSFA